MSLANIIIFWFRISIFTDIPDTHLDHHGRTVSSDGNTHQEATQVTLNRHSTLQGQRFGSTRRLKTSNITGASQEVCCLLRWPTPTSICTTIFCGKSFKKWPYILASSIIWFPKHRSFNDPWRLPCCHPNLGPSTPANLREPRWDVFANTQ